eukprot:CAMPEP_0117660608 /NCGR_PEP_ID=MMETSP0804-20121206/7058_1 /TAXON_ID=1074897 /ORGANISM="Tetraselmis astigmatica, Strain CCMP880" /LENGTH=615 /DNA_ID=CAMNT_0005467347 /DNA_START=51 /DNA_END=1899 /DNA_ORIENTATION=-
MLCLHSRASGRAGPLLRRLVSAAGAPAWQTLDDTQPPNPTAWNPGLQESNSCAGNSSRAAAAAGNNGPTPPAAQPSSASTEPPPPSAWAARSVQPTPSSSAAVGGPEKEPWPRPKVIRQLVEGRVHETVLMSLANGVVQRHSQSTEDTTLELRFKKRKISLATTIRQQLAATFLPAGYPATVGPNYLPYVWWRALQQCSSSANGVLASSFLLYSVGLGQGAIPTAGAVNWVLKDGLGQAGTLLAARFMAQTFDENSRGWYIRGSILLNLATMIEIATVFAPEYFLVMGAGANTLKGLTWMALGATSAAFNLAFQQKNNIADIHARSTTQSITVSLVGTAAGAWFASIVGQSPTDALAVSAALCGVNLLAAHQASKSVPLQTLNPVRSQILAGIFADTAVAAMKSGRSPCAGDPCPLPSPKEVAKIDPVSFWPKSASRLFINALYKEPQKLVPPVIGTPLHKAAALSPKALQLISRVHADRQCMVFPMGGEVHMILRDSATEQDFLDGILQSELLRRELLIALHGGCGGGETVARKALPMEELPLDLLEAAMNRSLSLSSRLGSRFRDELVRAGGARSASSMMGTPTGLCGDPTIGRSCSAWEHAKELSGPCPEVL